MDYLTGWRLIGASVTFFFGMWLLDRFATWFVYVHEASFTEWLAVMGAIFAVAFWIERRKTTSSD